MQGPDFIFCLQDKDFNFWGINAAGNVVKSGDPYFLEFSPSGWDDLAIQNIRNKRYWGIDRSVSLPLSYVNDGAKIIKHVFYKFGIEADLFLSISNLNLDYVPNTHYNFWYKQIYRAEIDLSDFSHAGTKVTCRTLEDGLAKYLKSNENTVYEYPVNVPEAVTIEMDGINLHNKVDNLITNGTNIATPNFDRGNHTVDLLITQEDAPYVGGKKAVPRVKYGFDNTALFNSGLWFLNSSVSGVLNFNYDFTINFNFPYSSISLNPAANFRVHLIQFNAGGAIVNEFVMYDSGTSDPNRFNNRTVRIHGSGAIGIVPGTFIYFNAFCNASGSTGADSIQTTYTDPNGFFNYSYLFRHPISYIKGFRPQYLFEKLFASMTDNAYAVAISNYFATYKNVIITSGNALRKLADASVKISFGNDFFQFFDSFDAVGLNIVNKQVNFDTKKNLVDINNIIDLPEPSEGSLVVNIAKEYLYNELEIGYPEISNEIGVLNGNEEYNDKMLFSLGTMKGPAKLNKVSLIKTSPYEIEKIRITTFQIDTTDYKNDNSLYALHIENNIQVGGYYKLDRSLNAGATGVIEASTVFNMFFSPKRNLNRNGAFLRSSLFLCDTKILKFISADKNKNLVAGGVIESADVNIGSLDPVFFYPLFLNFVMNSPYDLIDLLNINPLQLFRFPVKGVYFYGILNNIKTALSNGGEQQWQLLASSLNNMQKLIEYYGE